MNVDVITKMDGTLLFCEFRGWGLKCKACLTGRKTGCTFAASPKILGELAAILAPWNDLDPNGAFFILFFFISSV